MMHRVFISSRRKNGPKGVLQIISFDKLKLLIAGSGAFLSLQGGDVLLKETDVWDIIR